MWHRDCEYCGASDWDMSPSRSKCDVAHYYNVYLPRKKKEKEGNQKWQQA